MDQGIKSEAHIPWGVGGMKAKNRKDRMQERKNEWGKGRRPEQAVHILCYTRPPSPSPQPTMFLVPGPFRY